MVADCLNNCNVPAGFLSTVCETVDSRQYLFGVGSQKLDPSNITMHKYFDTSCGHGNTVRTWYRYGSTSQVTGTNESQGVTLMILRAEAMAKLPVPGYDIPTLAGCSDSASGSARLILHFHWSTPPLYPSRYCRLFDTSTKNRHGNVVSVDESSKI